MKDKIIHAAIIICAIILALLMLYALLPLHITRAEMIALTDYPEWIKLLLY